MTGLQIPVLPATAKLEYLGEGAANIVYRIATPSSDTGPGTPPSTEIEEYGAGTPPPSEIEFEKDGPSGEERMVFENKLLRVRKNLATTLPCQTAQTLWSSLIAPLFPSSQLVQQSLVSLRPESQNHITSLNASLKEWEASPNSNGHRSGRPEKRQGIYLANDEHGLLVTDMSGADIVQFKPKWLAQSPSAPEEARRCRQCALVAMREAQGNSDGVRFCPLDLMSEDEEVVRRVAREVLGPDVEQVVVQMFERWVKGTGLLRRLRDVQVKMDQGGVLAATPTSTPSSTPGGDLNENLRVAMTLRDCSVFVRLNGDLTDGNEIEARIGDLDVKSPDKLSYWQETEWALIKEGWYTATEKVGRKENVCSLGRTSGSGRGGREAVGSGKTYTHLDLLQNFG
ncbi:hypothetical protein VTL71DRAFT_7794 [Oculimacula yallundae]|uniref:Inositol-pentakisphosphate 2-kinase n=1 Tax=Oculimacula yallundae TaxID=86028 RepID=A0ABR4CX30_9HELO